MTSVLVTGITGFIGSNLAKALAHEGYTVYGLVKPSSSRNLKPISELLDRVVLLTGDICSLHSIVYAMRAAGPDHVCHLAAITPVRNSFERPFEYVQCNYVGTMNVVHAMLELPNHKGRRLIGASTAEVYGIQDAKQPLTRDLELRPSSPYSVSKAAADMYLRMASKIYDLNSTILRPSNTYGRHYETGYIVEYLITKMLSGERVFVGAPDSVRDYIHVSDHVKAYLQALERDSPSGEAYNIGGGLGITNRALAEMIADMVGYHLNRATFGAYPPGYPTRPIISDQPYLVLDASKAKKDLGWEPSVRLEDGLLREIEYWKKMLSRKEQGYYLPIA